VSTIPPTMASHGDGLERVSRTFQYTASQSYTIASTLQLLEEGWKTFVVTFAPSLFEFDWADRDNDNKVTILDAAHLAFCYDTTPSSPIWSSCKYWDLCLQDKVTILDAALVAFLFDQTSGSSPFPGQGQPAGQMDSVWKSSCSTLTHQILTIATR